jgi:diadenylate cyclase
MLLPQLPLHILISDILFACIDILIITYIFYKFYQILAQTKAAQVIKGLLFFVFLYFLARIARLETFYWLLNQISSVVVIAIIILFQPELRRVLTTLGQSNWLNNLMKKDPKNLNYIINAIQNFQILNIGALIVFERNVGLRNIVESGTLLNAKVSTSLLITIFSNKTPLHDGAVLIKNDTVIAAGCFLPLSDSDKIKSIYGTRHRAALGMAEESDAVVAVVSEETGKISLAYDGKLHNDYEIEELKKELAGLLGYDEESENEDLADDKIP